MDVHCLVNEAELLPNFSGLYSVSWGGEKFDAMLNIESPRVDIFSDPINLDTFIFRSVKVNIYGLEGICIAPNRWHILSKQIEITIGYSDLTRFFTSSKKLAITCSDSEYGAGLFGGFAAKFELVFGLGSKYSDQTCPLVFRNTSIGSLKINDIVRSQVRWNSFQFTTVDKLASQVSLNTSIRSFTYSGYGIQFDSKVFDSLVFENTQLLIVQGTLFEFKTEVLCQSKLIRLFIKVSNMRQFLQQNLNYLACVDNRRVRPEMWVVLQDLLDNPQDSNQDVAKIVNSRDTAEYQQLYQVRFKSKFSLKEEDFCLFASYKRMGSSLKFSGNLIMMPLKDQCTCLIYWLYKHDLTMGHYKGDWLYNNVNFDCDIRANELEMSCDFPKMEARCDSIQFNSIQETNAYEFMFAFDLPKMILVVIFTPLISFLGLLFNLLSIITFKAYWKSAEYRKQKLADQNSRMWEYVYMNCWFQMLHAAVMLIEPLTDCIEYNGIYCSPLILTRFVKWLYLLGVSYSGNVFKLSANMTNTAFVLFRFAVNLDKWQRLRQLKVHKVTASIVAFSLLISIIRLFVNERYDVSIFAESRFSYLFRNNFSGTSKNVLLKIISLTNLIMGNLMFTLLNLAIDITLLNRLRKISVMGRKESAEWKITRMILINGFFSLLFRTPEIVASIVELVFNVNPLLVPLCRLTQDAIHSLCPTLFKFAGTFYSLTFGENFLILLLFNSSFKKTFLNMIKNFKSRLCPSSTS
nr:G protein-coupled receptor [Proales similis]